MMRGVGCVAVLFCIGCTSGEGIRPDAAAPDATTNAPPPDAGTVNVHPDAGTVEVHPDAGTVEAHPDAGTVGAHPDAGSVEAHPDAGAVGAPPDAGSVDVHPDAGTVEAHPDAGTVGAPPDAGSVEVHPDASTVGAPPDASQVPDAQPGIIAEVSSPCLPITIQIHISDGLPEPTCALDGEPPAACAGPEITFDTLAPGPHVLLVAAGGSSLGVPFTVDGSGPVLGLAGATSTADGAALDVDFTADEPFADLTAELVVTRDTGGEDAAACDCTGATCRCPEPAPGANRIRARAQDACGNPSSELVALPTTTVAPHRGRLVMSAGGVSDADLITRIYALAGPTERPLHILLSAPDDGIERPYWGRQLERDGVVVYALPEASQLEAFLPGYDVLVIGNFPEAANLEAIGASWQPILEPFLDAGGIVVLFEGWKFYPSASVPTATYQLAGSLLPVDAIEFVPRPRPAAYTFRHRYGATGPSSAVTHGLALSTLGDSQIIFNVADPDATTLVFLVPAQNPMVPMPVLVDKVYPVTHLAFELPDSLVDDHGQRLIQSTPEVLYDATAVIDAAAVECWIRDFKVGNDVIAPCGIDLPPLSGAFHPNFGATPPGGWNIDVVVRDSDGSMRTAAGQNVFLTDPLGGAIERLGSTSCPTFLPYPSFWSFATLDTCRLDAIDGDAPVTIDERPCNCTTPNVPFEPCRVSFYDSYDPRNFDLDGSYRLTATMHNPFGDEGEMSAEFEAHCPAWVSLNDQRDDFISIGSTNPTWTAYFNLGFEPGGYQSITCTATQIGPPDTILRSWQCADLQASGKVSGTFAFAVPSNQVRIQYRFRVEVVDADGNPASDEKGFTVDWVQ